MMNKRYKYAVASTVKDNLVKIKKYKESYDELSNKLVILISTCIRTNVTAAGALVSSATAITQEEIDTCKIAAIDSTQ